MDADSLFGEIRPHARGVPEPMMRRALVRAARIFCRKTWYVRRAVALTMVADTAMYALRVVDADGNPANEEAVGVKYAQVQDGKGGAWSIPSASASEFDPRFGP